MNILVCVKQVPDTTAVKIDPVTNTLIRDGVPSILNPFDGFALEMALQMKDKTGGTVTVMSMGPAQAEDVLRESLCRWGRRSLPGLRSGIWRLGHPGYQLHPLLRRQGR